jgi:hypothetical protein
MPATPCIRECRPSVPKTRLLKHKDSRSVRAIQSVLEQ